MSVQLTRRGRVVAWVTAGVAAVGLGAATAAVIDRIEAGSTDASSTAAESTDAGSTAAESTDASSDALSPAGTASPTASPTAEPAGTKAWAVPQARQALAGQIAGYAQPFVHPGEAVELRVSTTAAKYRVIAYRIGDYQGKGATKVGSWGPLTGTDAGPAGADPDTRAVQADWPVSKKLDTQGWEPGLYLVALTTVSADPKTYTVPVVVASDSAADKVVLVAGDTTWQAYNTWGGRSAYQGPDGKLASRSRAVSFARPYNWSGYRWPAAFDIPLIRLAERMDIPLAYASVSSISADPQSLTGALGIVSNGHDEYWTAKYRNALVQARDTGTNLAFLGANAGYWQTRFRDDGWTALMPKEAPMLRWRDNADAVAENAITGVVYDCFPARTAMVIRQPGFFLFRGTKVTKGTRITNLVGAETDRVYPLDSTPRPIQVPALSPVSCNGARTWSTMSYYTNPSGAGVFATGTMDWVRAMGGPRGQQGLGDDALKFTRRVTANLLTAMAAGPMGKTHPATDNLDRLGLPATSTTNVSLGTLR